MHLRHSVTQLLYYFLATECRGYIYDAVTFP